MHRQRTRFAEALLAAPSRTDRYFDDHPSRRLLWLAIAFASGDCSPCALPAGVIETVVEWHQVLQEMAS